MTRIMNKINGGDPAFAATGSYNIHTGDHNGDTQIGLSKREYFAGLAMQGLLAGHDAGHDRVLSYITEKAVSMADALIEQLNKELK